MTGIRKTRKARKATLAEVSAVSTTTESVSPPHKQMYRVDPSLLAEVQAFNTGNEEALCAALDAAEQAFSGGGS